jgi:hypothetical protein
VSDCRSDWYAGLTCDHLYANCTNRQRARAELERSGWWNVGTGTSDISGRVDPHGGDICGMCLHRHNAAVHN